MKWRSFLYRGSQNNHSTAGYILALTCMLPDKIDLPLCFFFFVLFFGFSVICEAAASVKKKHISSLCERCRERAGSCRLGGSGSQVIIATPTDRWNEAGLKRGGNQFD